VQQQQRGHRRHQLVGQLRTAEMQRRQPWSKKRTRHCPGNQKAKKPRHAARSRGCPCAAAAQCDLHDGPGAHRVAGRPPPPHLAARPTMGGGMQEQQGRANGRRSRFAAWAAHSSLMARYDPVAPPIMRTLCVVLCVCVCVCVCARAHACSLPLQPTEGLRGARAHCTCAAIMHGRGGCKRMPAGSRRCHQPCRAPPADQQRLRR
jgi:hypothetical protein